MKAISAGILIALLLVLAMALKFEGRDETPRLLYEGPMHSLQWTDGAGETHGLTKASVPEAVPGGSGSWKINRYVRVFDTHVEIIDPEQPDLGLKLIPFDKIDYVQFAAGEKTGAKPGRLE